MHGERFLIGLEHDAPRSAGCLSLIRDLLAVFLGASDEGSRLVGHVTPNEWRVLQCRAGQGLPVEIVRRLIAADVFFEVLPLRLRRFRAADPETPAIQKQLHRVTIAVNADGPQIAPAMLGLSAVARRGSTAVPMAHDM